jgi:VWFA-related protein
MTRRVAPGVFAVALGLGALVATRVVIGQTPAFRTAVDVVRVDVSVLDAARRPIRGLTESDFTVLADGKPQKIVALSEIDVPDPVPSSVPWLRDVTPDVATNRFRDRRVWMILMDDATVQLDMWVVTHAKNIARDVVARMGVGDVAAVVFTRDNRASQDFTSDRTRLLAAIDRFSASAGSTSQNPDIPASPASPLNALMAVKAIKESAVLLASVPDRRKLLVLISGGVGIDIENLAPVPTLGEAAVGDREGAAQLNAAMSEALRAAISSNVNIYAFDPEGLPTASRAGAARLSQDFLRTLATSTGGRAAVNTNDATPAIDEMYAENKSYYLIGYQAPPRQGNRVADVVIKVNRDGANVRARRQVAATAATQARTAVLPQDQALSGLLPVSGLPLAVAAAPFRRSGSNAAVAVTLGVLEERGTTGRETIDLVTTAFDVDGKAQRTERTKGDVVFRQGIAAGEMVMYEVLSRIDLKPGRYQLRLAAHRNGADESGSVFTDIDVPDFAKEPVSLSGVVLSATPGPIAAPKDTFAGLIPVVPTTMRDFGKGTTVDAFVRIYQGGKGTVQPVTVSVQFIDAKNVAVLGRREPIDAINFLADRSAEYRVSVPVSTLAPGPYLMRIEVPLGKTTARRDVMFVVR